MLRVDGLLAMLTLERGLRHLQALIKLFSAVLSESMLLIHAKLIGQIV